LEPHWATAASADNSHSLNLMERMKQFTFFSTIV